MSIILYNDQFLPREEGKVDIEDRGYQFGDGIYEAIRVYNGRFFLLDLHMKRLERSSKELRLALPYGIDQLTRNLEVLIEKNNIIEGEVYFQITRGDAPRNHIFPQSSKSVLMGSAGNLKREDIVRPEGIKASLQDDIRWLRCDIKTLNLLGNVLAKQKAYENGAEEAIFHRGNIVTEGGSCNAFIVKDGILITHPADHFILNGITRIHVLDIAKRLGIPVQERTFTTSELLAADEAFITSTGVEVTPVVQVDDKFIGSGKPGPVTKRLFAAFDEDVKQLSEAYPS